jgi:mannose-6-phosphate isomerase-like protein (cupin superfamily)
MTRRVVTGLDAEGKSCILIDGPVKDQGLGGANLVWTTDAIPADNSGMQDIDDTPFGFEMMHAGGSIFMVLEYPPGMGCDKPYWHATDTIDYIVMLNGEVVLSVETGEVVLRAGDMFVDRGVAHAWRNETSLPASFACINLPALPVGKGKTV